MIKGDEGSKDRRLEVANAHSASRLLVPTPTQAPRTQSPTDYMVNFKQSKINC